MIQTRENDKYLMKRVIELAENGRGNVLPNPMVGCVVVRENRIIAEGFHRAFGGPHAEVNALLQINDEEILKDSTLYVNLEPCSHFGKTPPCSQLIIGKKIPRVVIGTMDPNPLVSGKGIEQLKQAGIQVEVGVLEKECRELNKRFFTYHEKKRPYIILKWARTTDGFTDKTRTDGSTGINWITGPNAKRLVHLWRSEEQAILVGINTVINDNPSLTVREVSGKNPLRIVIDKSLRTPVNAAVIDDSARTIIFCDHQTTHPEKHFINTEIIAIDFSRNILPQVLHILYELNIQSLIVEGGSHTIRQFISEGLWDEARILTGNTTFGSGLKSPELHGGMLLSSTPIGDDKLEVYARK